MSHHPSCKARRGKGVCRCPRGKKGFQLRNPLATDTRNRGTSR